MLVFTRPRWLSLWVFLMTLTRTSYRCSLSISGNVNIKTCKYKEPMSTNIYQTHQCHISVILSTIIARIENLSLFWPNNCNKNSQPTTNRKVPWQLIDLPVSKLTPSTTILVILYLRNKTGSFHFRPSCKTLIEAYPVELKCIANRSYYWLLI